VRLVCDAHIGLLPFDSVGWASAKREKRFARVVVLGRIPVRTASRPVRHAPGRTRPESDCFRQSTSVGQTAVPTLVAPIQAILLPLPCRAQPEAACVVLMNGLRSRMRVHPQYGRIRSCDCSPQCPWHPAKSIGVQQSGRSWGRGQQSNVHRRTHFSRSLAVAGDPTVTWTWSAEIRL